MPGRGLIRMILFSLFFLWLTVPVLAAEEPESPNIETRESVTRHALEVAGQGIEYTVTAGTLIVGAETEKNKAVFFYVAYEKLGEDADGRPVTFAFNGGPGASSAFLHLGGLGPKRLDLKENGAPPPPPARLVDNDETWLRFTDLVFIDPVGTGFSKSTVGGEKGNRSFWGVESDVRSVAGFIRDFLTRHDRWLSPKYIVGESYGGTRLGALTGVLQSVDFGVDVSGCILISPALDLGTVSSNGNRYNLLPWVLVLPSYAATAAYHQKTDPWDKEKNEHFSLSAYLPALAGGEAIPPDEYSRLIEQISSISGLDKSFIRQRDLRVGPFAFSKELLLDQNLLLGIYDGRLTGIDPDPNHPTRHAYDPSGDPFESLFTAAINDYIRRDLKFEIDAPYLLINYKANLRWEWNRSENHVSNGRGWVVVTDDLRRAMTLNDRLRVFIAAGYYDLITPYFSQNWAITHMGLDKRLKKNLVFECYRSGHMIYQDPLARQALFNDVRRVYMEAAR